MPLSKSTSKKAFSKNVETEMKAGKPQPQALAIAYNIKNRSKKKMAKGGKVEQSAKDEMRPMPDQEFADEAERKGKSNGSPSDWMDRMPEEAASKGPMPKLSRPPEENMYAEGGMIDEEAPHSGESEFDMRRRHAMELAAFAEGGEVEDEEGYMSPAESIMAKRRREHMMADGGMVDLEKNSEESLNNEDQMSFDAGLKEQYDDSQISPQPEDSNEHGDDSEDEEENQHDMVASIRKKMKYKQQIG